MKRTVIKSLAAAGILALGIGACSSGGSTSNGKTSGSSGVTIAEEANTGVTFVRDFNPFDPNSLAAQMNMRTLIYEPLFEFDPLRPGVVHPWLGTSYAWSNGGKTLTVHLRPGVKWSDGQPFTSKDVAYTFNMISKNAAGDYSGAPPVASVSTPSATTVVLSYSAPQYASLFSILGYTVIVPEHLWQSVASPATAKIVNPVGTGPYVLKNFTTQLVTLTANPHYWGGKPPVTQVDIPYYSSNTAATTALADGQLDWAGNEIPNLSQLYVSKDPSTNHYWFPAGNTVTLWINVGAGGPLADPKVRQAISAGIDRQQLSTKGEYGYEQPATSTTGLTLPAQQAYLASAQANNISPTADAAKVASILTADGYKKDSKGIWAKNGKEISFAIEDPSAYTDYYADTQLISSQLKAAGINATVDGVAAPKWYSDFASGHFQTMIHWGGGVGGVADPYPFGQYENWMNDKLSAPEGKTAPANFGRYDNAQAQSAIAAYEATDSSSAQMQDTRALGSIESAQLPVIPLLYGADWNEYSTAKVTGWPTSSNPYMDPSPDDPELPYILMHLKPAS
jgi:peptide/nickel transport system substrate-binding protein